MADRGGVSGVRTLEQVKAEILRRAGRNSPLEHITPEDAQAAVAALTSLDRDHWAEVWCTIGLRHEAQGDALQQQGAEAQVIGAAWFLAYANCRTGRYPVASTAGKAEAHRHSLRCFRKAARYFDPPLQAVEMLFEGKTLTGYLQVPAGVSPPPVVIHWGGVDGWKEDRQRNSGILHAHGLATFTMDMPGTGDSPLRFTDPAAERTFSAAIDHLQQRDEVDGARVGVWGGSFGGYWAAKLAHVESARIKAAVTQGGNVHYGFQREWLEPALTRTAATYLLGPASLLDARSWVLGVRTLAEVLDVAPQLSLLDQGLLDGPCAPLLAVNGKRDDQAPIEDVYILQEHGMPKSVRVYPDGGHMGRTPGMKERVVAELIANWLRDTLIR
ncbi:MAG: alpha/beta fold hydrolase [Burkholderiales bacterium]|nr:alpha/beta fold hydrolase [Burkholderiales bacterium]